MTALFFLFLAITQAVLGVVGLGTAFVLSWVPALRGLLGPMTQAAILGSAGGFAGTVAAFVLVILGGSSCKGLEALHLVQDCFMAADAAPWALLLGYVAALLAGGAIGWRRGSTCNTTTQSHASILNARDITGMP